VTEEQAKTVIQELTIIRKLIYTYGLGEDIPGGPSPGILAGIKDEIHELRESLEGTPMKTRTPNPPDPMSELSDNIDQLRKEVSALNLAIANLTPVLEGIQKALETDER
jgi:polyhydroxyalkanoate synthesis regulator phasin